MYTEENVVEFARKAIASALDVVIDMACEDDSLNLDDNHLREMAAGLAEGYLDEFQNAVYEKIKTMKFRKIISTSIKVIE